MWGFLCFRNRKCFSHRVRRPLISCSWILELCCPWTPQPCASWPAVASSLVTLGTETADHLASGTWPMFDAACLGILCLFCCRLCQLTLEKIFKSHSFISLHAALSSERLGSFLLWISWETEQLVDEATCFYGNRKAGRQVAAINRRKSAGADGEDGVYLHALLSPWW